MLPKASARNVEHDKDKIPDRSEGTVRRDIISDEMGMYIERRGAEM